MREKRDYMIAIGIDIGGTSIKYAAVDSTGKVFDKEVQEIISGESQEVTIKKLINNIKDYINKYNLSDKVSGIGLGIPGSIDTKEGVVTYSNNLNWKELHVVDLFKKEISLPVKITNDANAAALGEKVFGAGKKYKDVVMITLGTGVGSGIIIDGKIYEGLKGKGAEIGHSTLVVNGLDCTCGRKGCFEMYASATALIRQTKEAMDLDKASLMWEEFKQQGKVSGRTAFNAAKKGDETAIKVVDNYVMYLSEGLLNICNIFRPECIVLSGGIANQGDYLLDKVKAYCKKYDYGYPNSPVTEIKVAEIGYDSGIIGAACLILNV